jgi:hypothetical protein
MFTTPVLIIFPFFSVISHLHHLILRTFPVWLRLGPKSDEAVGTSFLRSVDAPVPGYGRRGNPRKSLWQITWGFDTLAWMGKEAQF